MSYQNATLLFLRNLGGQPGLELTFSVRRPSDPFEGNLTPFATDELDIKVEELRALEDDVSSDVVEELGEQLYSRLSQNPDVPGVLDSAIRASMRDPRPFHIVFPDVDRERAEAIPWEMVRHPQSKYLGLLETCPITRIVRSTAPLTTDEDVFEPPVRIAAVLGADGMDSRQEVDALRDALSGWQLPWKLKVFLAEIDLVNQINAESSAEISAELTPDSANGLIGKINEFGPYLLHMLGHGSNRGGGRVQITTRMSLHGDEPLHMNSYDVARMASSTWLLTLNVCLGAAPDEENASLASGLLAQGVRGVVAMREPIRYDTATRFSGALYGEIGIALKQLLEPGADVDLHWGAVVTRARNGLSNGTPNSKAWTLPVLYLQPKPIRLTVPMADVAAADTDVIQTRLAEISELTRMAREFEEMERPELVAAVNARISDIRHSLLVV